MKSSRTLLFVFLLMVSSTQVWGKEHFLLITGCGRSGTSYISHVMRAAGLRINHEKMGADGISSWPMAVDHSTPLYGPSTEGRTFTHTFHQVRDPINVISSWYFNDMDRNVNWSFICKAIPEISRDEPFLIRCVKYWIYWNLKAEEKAEFTYRVEDLENVFDEMSQRLGVPLKRGALKAVSKTKNTRKNSHKKLSWALLKSALEEEDFALLQQTAHRYGYPISDPE